MSCLNFFVLNNQSDHFIKICFLTLYFQEIYKEISVVYCRFFFFFFLSLSYNHLIQLVQKSEKLSSGRAMGSYYHRATHQLYIALSLHVIKSVIFLVHILWFTIRQNQVEVILGFRRQNSWMKICFHL